MPDHNGNQTKTDLAHRIGIWVAVLAISAKLFAVGSWVGAADEKFDDAATVETTQRTMLLQLNTVATKQIAIEDAIEDNKDAIETSKQEVLAAIAAIQE